MEIGKIIEMEEERKNNKESVMEDEGKEKEEKGEK